jgi:thiamine biosynthesis lipoprotein
MTVTRREEHRRYADARGFGVADWPALGTTAHLVVTTAHALDEARAAVESVLADIDLAASRFRSDSQISRLNSAGGAWVPIGTTLAHVLRVGVDAAEWTAGLVDPTVGGLLVDYGYDRTFAAVAPDGPPVSLAVRQSADWTSIELDEAQLRARVPGGVVVDLGATAKGLAADLAAAAATAATGAGVVVGLGGDISVDGPAPVDGWPVTIADVSDLSLPYADDASQTVVLREGGLATSSVSARRWRRGGSELHHIIDPRSAAPADGPWRTVSVTGVTCALANAASTAAVVLGDGAVSWLQRRGMHARLVSYDGSVTYVGDWPRPGATP